MTSIESTVDSIDFAINSDLSQPTYFDIVRDPSFFDYREDRGAGIDGYGSDTSGEVYYNGVVIVTNT